MLKNINIIDWKLEIDFLRTQQYFNSRKNNKCKQISNNVGSHLVIVIRNELHI